MRLPSLIAKLVVAGVVLGTIPAALSGERGAQPGKFDFYVLSLSWSPSYCAAEGAEANRQQCGTKRPYAFVVHGLWPQYEAGYPEFCRLQQSGHVPGNLVNSYQDIMPSGGLMGHQWRKHGSCTGLRQATYFALARKAREKINIPPEFSRLTAPLLISPKDVEERFISVNPGLEEQDFAVTCDRRYLREVRICMTKDLAFRACEELDTKGCRADRMLMPPARGR